MGLCTTTHLKSEVIQPTECASNVFSTDYMDHRLLGDLHCETTLSSVSAISVVFNALREHYPIL